MDENRIEGTARKYGGRVQESVGSVTGDTKKSTTQIDNGASFSPRDTPARLQYRT